MSMRILLLGMMTMIAFNSQAATCPPLLAEQGQLPQLRQAQPIDLCQRFAGKVLLVVNTASHCGFTGQFKGLEALYQRYREQGLEILGVPSGDFRQEADDSAETAAVCFINYGVTFAMSEPQHVRGAQTIPLFQALAEQGSAPRWNFYKYLIGRDGRLINSYSSLTKPDSSRLRKALEQALAE